MGNDLARQLELAGAEVQCDTQCKKVLSQRVILAWILKYVTEEFRNLPLPEIGAYIEEEPRISEVPVNPRGEDARAGQDAAMRTLNGRISGLSNEDKRQGEGAVYYDIRFNVRLPEEESGLRMLIDLEGQKRYSPGYEIVTRGIFYGARMISAQLGTEFEDPDYDGVCKVVSIWVCMDAPPKAGNTIARYEITKKDLWGIMPDRRRAYDKMTVIMVALNERMETENILLRMLNTLLSPRKSYAEKKAKLKSEFQIDLDGKAEKEINTMCNYSEYVLEVGRETGLREGHETGLREGLDLGRQEGGVQSTISLCREFGQSRQDTLSRICRDFSLAEETANQYLDRYWNGAGQTV